MSLNSYSSDSTLRLSCDLAPYVQGMTKEPVAFGRFSSIFRANLSNQSVAIKRITTINVEAKQTEEMIKHEFAAWHQLSHPNILPLIGICYLGGDTCASFVSPWQKNGKSLDFFRDNPSLNLLQLLQNIGNAISYLHSNNLIHGDIRAANIYISSSKQPLLAGFGTCKLSCSGITTFTEMRGNIRWSAQELFKETNGTFDGHGACHSQASDCWAFGMTILELFTGARPYSDDNWDFSVIKKISNGILPQMREALHPQWQKYQEPLWAICLQCWEHDPAERATIDHLVSILSSTPAPPSPGGAFTGSPIPRQNAVEIPSVPILDYKTTLNNYLSRMKQLDGLSIEYAEDGLCHILIWRATITFNQTQVGNASGRTKVEACNKASKEALKNIRRMFSLPCDVDLRIGLPPVAPTIDSEFSRTGPDHNPKWTCRVLGESGLVEGSGRKKVEARTEAVINTID